MPLYAIDEEAAGSADPPGVQSANGLANHCHRNIIAMLAAVR